MADVIKKVTVPQTLLQELDWDTEGYLLRYRIVSESRNIRSHWSPVYFFPGPIFEEVEGSIAESVGPTGREILVAAWENDYNLAAYDIFIAFPDALTIDGILYDGNYFSYRGRLTTNSYSFTFNPEASSARVIVQPATNKKTIKQSFIIFDQTYTPVS